MSTPEPPPFPGDSSPGGSGGLPSYGSVPPPPNTPGDSSGSVPPPPPPPPPPTPPSSAQGFSAPEAIAWGWRKFTENVGPAILAAITLIAVTIAVGIGAGALLGGGVSATSPGQFQFQATGPGAFIAQLIQSVVGTLLGGAAAKAALEVTEGKAFDFFGAFGKVNLVQLMIAGLVVGIATKIGFMLLFIPGLIVAFLTLLTTYSIVEGERSAIDGIKHSVKLISENLGNALLLVLLSALVLFAGLIALCVGVVVAVPVTVFATAYAYRLFNGQPVAP